jgi:hypothetical protein
MVLPALVAAVSAPLTSCSTITRSSSQSGHLHRPTAATYADYSVLGNPGPSGIITVRPAEASAERQAPAGPMWVVVPPSGLHGLAAPVIASARLARQEGTVRVWLSKNTAGGLCVLVFSPHLASDPKHDHSVAAWCGTKMELGRPSYVNIRDDSGSTPWSVVGTVPNGSHCVFMHLANGATSTARVRNNSYRALIPRRVVSVTSCRQDGSDS